MIQSNHLDVVLKISKHCNLRCTYCYEYEELADRSRMSLDQIGRVFDTLRRYTDVNDSITSIRFAWQGGEPMLIKPEVYRAIGDRCEAAFAGTRVAVSHVVQTNLTALSAAWLTFLREGRFFSDVGISFDVVGDCRVDVKGQLRTATVLTNLQALIDARVPFAAIAVISRPSLPGIAHVHGFFDELGIETRFLPFNQSVSDRQFQDHAVHPHEIADAFKGLFDRWMASDLATSMEPVREYLGYALNVLRGVRWPGVGSDLDQLESVFIVHTNGNTWGMADLYVPDACYGNLFEEEFSDILGSPSRRRASDRLRARVSTVCGACPYFGACPGFGVAFAMPDERAALALHGCVVRTMIDHILDRLGQTESPDALGRTGARDGHGNPAIATSL